MVFSFFFFKVFIKTSKRIPIGSAGKRAPALRLVNLPSLKVILPQCAEILLYNTDVCMVVDTKFGDFTVH